VAIASTIFAMKFFMSSARARPTSITSSWLVSMPVSYSSTHLHTTTLPSLLFPALLYLFVMRLQANTFMPAWCATSVSGTVLMPTLSAPSVLSSRTSATVS